MAQMILLLAAALFTADPPQLVLGRVDAGSDLEVSAPEGAKVSITASVGSVGEVKREGGVVRARFHPPRANVPAVALLLAQIDRDGARELRWLALPLSGSDTMEIETRPGAGVEAEVAGKTFGPVKADAKGVVTLHLVVPPGVAKGTLRIIDKLGNVNQKPLDLDPPPFARLRMAARGESASASAPLELEIFAVRPDGSPDDSARIELRPAEGEAELVERIGHGVYLARYLPPRTKSGTVRVEAAAGGQAASVQVPVRPSAADEGMALWPSSLSSQKPWSVSVGLLGGGGATWDGATAGTLLFEAAVRIESLPEEVLLEIGPGFFSSAASGQQPRALLVQLGLRIHRELAHGFDVHAALLAGLSRQTIPVGAAGATQEGWGGRLGLAAGFNLRLGPGRALAQLQFDLSPSALSGVNGLGGVQVLAGYLVTLR
jgi:hypothetical protein